jgi:hypothetical protein
MSANHLKILITTQHKGTRVVYHRTIVLHDLTIIAVYIVIII